MANTGQVCCAVKRMYVHEDVYDKVVDKLVECANNAKLGDGFEEGVEYGPLNNSMQFEKVFYSLFIYSHFIYSLFLILSPPRSRVLLRMPRRVGLKFTLVVLLLTSLGSFFLLPFLFSLSFPLTLFPDIFTPPPLSPT